MHILGLVVLYETISNDTAFSSACGTGALLSEHMTVSPEIERLSVSLQKSLSAILSADY